MIGKIQILKQFNNGKHGCPYYGAKVQILSQSTVSFLSFNSSYSIFIINLFKAHGQWDDSKDNILQSLTNAKTNKEIKLIPHGRCQHLLLTR